MKKSSNTGIIFRLAIKNVVSSGLRGWLNIIALSFAFVINIFIFGIMDGWEKQAVRDSIDWEYGQGWLVNDKYDTEDPFTIEDGVGVAENTQGLTPVLIRQASIFPDGRMVNITIKGIPADQKVVDIPTSILIENEAHLPVVVGSGFANSYNLQVGDEMMLRWKDKYGSFDAQMVTIAGVFNTFVPAVDMGQMWMSTEDLWKITEMPNEASYYIADDSYIASKQEGWTFQSQDDLLADIMLLIDTKKSSSAFLTIVLLAIALIAVFDTQVFSVFKRQKEIGTFNALGMTKNQVKWMFTIEGTMYSILGVLFGLLYSSPLMYYLVNNGVPMNTSQGQEMGVVMPDVVYPVFEPSLIFNTAIMMVVLSIVISYLPVRKISKMSTVDALKGRRS